jgi:2-keto-4-pentenoate hydratase/2-oxohepta-3-ene-1,7-dioic acid hydratase in catechol pathway
MFMKIVRFVTDRGAVCLGAMNSDNQETATLLEGELLGSLNKSIRTERIGRLLSPIEPPNILAVGLNYGRHADETGVSRPDIPVLFIKATTSVIGSGEAILLPTAGPDAVDYEAELAVIIGSTAKNVTRDEAMNHVFGYCCANDVSARDWQIDKQKRQWSRGKSFDTFCPLGPCITTADEIPEPNRLHIRSILNGQVMQDSSTADMIFDIPSLVSDLSRSITLLPGTVILTGTPEGVGFTRKPPVFLQAGDEVTIEIEGIGRLVNRVEKETR